jgi:hypothetical protein
MPSTSRQAWLLSDIEEFAQSTERGSCRKLFLVTISRKSAGGVQPSGREPPVAEATPLHQWFTSWIVGVSEIFQQLSRNDECYVEADHIGNGFPLTCRRPHDGRKGTVYGIWNKPRRRWRLELMKWRLPGVVVSWRLEKL